MPALPGISFWRNVDGKHFERVPLPASGVTGGMGTDCDRYRQRWLDRSRCGCRNRKRAGGARLWRNRGAQGFEDVSDAVGLQ